MWVGSFTVSTAPRRRKTVYSRSREGLLAKIKALGLSVDQPAGDPYDRQSALQAARALGTHSGAEWTALCRRTPACRYCGVSLTYWNDAKDHRVPIARGGSDSIDNLQRICWECNLAKGALTDDEYAYKGAPRGFRPHPAREHDYLQTVALAERRRAAARG